MSAVSRPRQNPPGQHEIAASQEGEMIFCVCLCHKETCKGLEIEGRATEKT